MINKHGMSALILVVIVGTVSLVLVTGMMLSSLGTLEQGFTYHEAQRAALALDGCVEEALKALRENSDYLGTELNLGGAHCILRVQTAGQVHMLFGTSTISQYTRTVQVQLRRTEQGLTVTSWKE